MRRLDDIKSRIQMVDGVPEWRVDENIIWLLDLVERAMPFMEWVFNVVEDDSPEDQETVGKWLQDVREEETCRLTKGPGTAP